MEVTLLGTGSAYVKENCASQIVDRKILIDVGPGNIKQLIRLGYSLEEIEMVLITHLHSDHYFDLPFLIVNLEVSKITKPLYIVGPIGIEEKIKKICQIAYGNYFDHFLQKKIKFVEMNKDMKEINLIKNYNIEIFEVSHPGLDSFGFVINKKLGITGDSRICNAIYKIVKESEVTIADVSMIEGNQYHMGIDNIKEILKQVKNKRIIATHLRKETKEKLEENEIENLLLLEDGSSFII